MFPAKRFSASATSGPISDEVLLTRSRPYRTSFPEASSGSLSMSGTVHAGGDGVAAPSASHVPGIVSAKTATAALSNIKVFVFGQIIERPPLNGAARYRSRSLM
ncbi:hypothetical protein HYPGJ_31388 [Hyphomicrobium sp. GJ21]|nr:hypothetical protein HYPGJ_31388 [Hyphomicrobium sp. GJ21]